MKTATCQVSGDCDIAPLYRRLLGADFDSLPRSVRELHDLTGTAVWVGRADVERGTSWTSRLVASLCRLPPTGRDQPVRVIFAVDGRGERWTRAFGSCIFRSTQRKRGGFLVERVGPFSLIFSLVPARDGLALDLRRVRFIDIRVPAFLVPNVRTRESGSHLRYHFEVESHLPLSKLLIRYAGWLEKEGPARA